MFGGVARESRPVKARASDQHPAGIPASAGRGQCVPYSRSIYRDPFAVIHRPPPPLRVDLDVGPQPGDI